MSGVRVSLPAFRSFNCKLLSRLIGTGIISIPPVDRDLIEQLLAQHNIEYFALMRVQPKPPKWRVFCPSDSESPQATSQLIASLRPDVVIESAELIGNDDQSSWLHEIGFFFKDDSNG